MLHCGAATGESLASTTVVLLDVFNGDCNYGTCIVFDVVVLVEDMTCSKCGKSIFTVFSKVNIVKILSLK